MIAVHSDVCGLDVVDEGEDAAADDDDGCEEEGADDGICAVGG